VCSATLHVTHRPATEHHVGPVRVLADTRALAVCADHAATDEDLRRAVLTAVGDRLTFATRRQHVAHCGACAAVLDLPMRATTRSATVEPPDGPPFTLTFALPVVRCGGCGVDGVPPELADTVLLCAFAAVGASASGSTPRRIRSLLLRRHRRRAAPGSPGRP
jgi:hypothetical protein